MHASDCSRFFPLLFLFSLLVTTRYYSALNASNMNALGCRCNGQAVVSPNTGATVGNNCQSWGGDYGASSQSGLWCNVAATCPLAQQVPGVTGSFWAQCYVPVGVPCPVIWNRTDEMYTRYVSLCRTHTHTHTYAHTHTHTYAHTHTHTHTHT
jgi:hypothetical protein